MNNSIIRKTVQSYKRIINKKLEYFHEAKLCVTCCFKCLFQEFVKDPLMRIIRQFLIKHFKEIYHQI